MADHAALYHPQKKVSLCGHSFIRRLEDETYANPKLEKSMNIAEADITWLHKGGMTWFSFGEAREGKQAVIQSKPDLLYLELGTNDLDSYMPPLDVAQKAISVVNELLDSGVKRVILGEVIPRSRSGRVPLSMFEENEYAYNNFMTNMLIHEQASRRTPVDERFKNPHVWFWKHKGLRTPESCVLKWDGVHLNEDVGLPKLYGSIRMALLAGLRHLPL